MSAQAPVPADHPLKIAWDEYVQTDDYQNSRRWAETTKIEVSHPNLSGSLWGVFMEGFHRGGEAARYAGDETLSNTIKMNGSERAELLEEIDRLRNAIVTHRSQRADDRCVEDDDRLYEALGDGIKCDRRVGDKAAMLQNCERFIQNRCEAGGPWKSYAELEAEIARLNGLINTPHTADFMEALPLEAAHQIERWGNDHDEGKNPEDWFWLLGYLAGKAVHAVKTGDVEKAKHHTVSSAAVMLNWHRRLSGDDASFQPGTDRSESN